MPKTKTKPDRAEMPVTISGIPPELLRQIDELAAKEGRNRSNFLRREIEAIILSKRRSLAA